MSGCLAELEPDAGFRRDGDKERTGALERACLSPLRAPLAEEAVELAEGDRLAQGLEAARFRDLLRRLMKPFQAARASAPPVLTRRTPRAASSATVRPGPPISTFTGFGATASTTALICSGVFSPGA